MKLGRLLRWGRVPFLRRRLPYVADVVIEPARNATLWIRRPGLALYVHRIRRAIRQGETIIEA
jgi:hypothetical protein